MSELFRDLFAAAAKTAGVEELLSTHSAIVLERIARGAGATRWYWLRSLADLNRFYQRSYPGSVVSFYFDDRIKPVSLSDEGNPLKP